MIHFFYMYVYGALKCRRS